MGSDVTQQELWNDGPYKVSLLLDESALLNPWRWSCSCGASGGSSDHDWARNTAANHRHWPGLGGEVSDGE